MASAASRRPVDIRPPRDSTEGSPLWWERWWRARLRVERAAVVVGAILIVSGVVHAGVLVVSGGSWQGPLSYRKAASFGVSFGLTLITVTWATSFVTMPRVIRTILLVVFTVACFGETSLVTMQVWREVPSHYNLETPFDTNVAMGLAVGGGVLVFCILGFTVAALRVTVSPSMTLALRFGFVTLLGSMVVGAVMIAKGVTLARSGDFAEAYATGGSLKALHAVTMHAVLVVPGVAWLTGRRPWSEHTRLGIVAATIAAYTAGIVAVAAGLAR